MDASFRGSRTATASIFAVAAYNAMMDSVEKDKDKKILELQQIIRAQQEEIARLRAAQSSSEIPASPMAVNEPQVIRIPVPMRGDET